MYGKKTDQDLTQLGGVISDPGPAKDVIL